MQITFFAANETMGDHSDADCNAFRAWAAEQIEAEYPGAEVFVSKEQSLQNARVSFETAEKDDYAVEESVELFTSYLWDRYWRTR